MLDMPLRMLLVTIAGWLNEGQRARIDFLEEQLFIEHYHLERPHQGLGNQLIDGCSRMRRGSGSTS